VLTIDDAGRIAAIDRFTDNSMLSRFGLPRTLPAATELRGIQRRRYHRAIFPSDSALKIGQNGRRRGGK